MINREVTFPYPKNRYFGLKVKPVLREPNAIKRAIFYSSLLIIAFLITPFHGIAVPFIKDHEDATLGLKIIFLFFLLVFVWISPIDGDTDKALKIFNHERDYEKNAWIEDELAPWFKDRYGLVLEYSKIEALYDEGIVSIRGIPCSLIKDRLYFAVGFEYDEDIRQRIEKMVG